jgi:hypothetical protein
MHVKKVMVMFMTVIMIMSFMTCGFAATDLITVKSNIDNVTTENKYFVISGEGQPDTYIKLILNDQLNDKWVIGDTGMFARLIRLVLGDNYITLKATKNGEEQIVKGHIKLEYKDGVLQITVNTLKDLLDILFK